MNHLSILIVALPWLLATASALAQVACPQANSGGNPVVQQQHIFCGEVSGNPLRAKGFHSRPGGVNPGTITILPQTTITYPAGAPAGIYNLNRFNITEHGNTRTKAISTMFPNACNQAAVVAAIQNAVNHGVIDQDGRGFHGPSGATCQAGNPLASFNIIGFMDANGQVRTAWPDY
jgi:hypothetical protein